MVEYLFECNSHRILFQGLMVKSFFEWNSHLILFEALIVNPSLIRIDILFHLWV